MDRDFFISPLVTVLQFLSMLLSPPFSKKRGGDHVLLHVTADTIDDMTQTVVRSMINCGACQEIHYICGYFLLIL